MSSDILLKKAHQAEAYGVNQLKIAFRDIFGEDNKINTNLYRFCSSVGEKLYDAKDGLICMTVEHEYFRDHANQWRVNLSICLVSMWAHGTGNMSQTFVLSGLACSDPRSTIYKWYDKVMGYIKSKPVNRKGV